MDSNALNVDNAVSMYTYEDHCYTNDLISTFTFDNYVHLECNHGAIDARNRILAEKYNGPGLLVRGAIGSGKTHFLHSIGHEWFREQRTFLCMSAERFANYILSASYIQLKEFRESLHRLQGVIIDGITFAFGMKKVETELALLLATTVEHKVPTIVDGCFDQEHELQCDHRLRQQLNEMESVEILAPSQKDQDMLLHRFAEIYELNNPGDLKKSLNGTYNQTVRAIESSVRKMKAHQIIA